MSWSDNKNDALRVMALVDKVDSLLGQHVIDGNPATDNGEAMCLIMARMVYRAHEQGHGKLREIKKDACRQLADKIDEVAALRRWWLKHKKQTPRPTTDDVGHA